MSHPMLDRIAGALHKVHGTRGLGLAVPLLLLLALAEPGLPEGYTVWAVGPLFALLLVALGTLPREGVAVLQRARVLVTRDDAPRLMRHRLAWGAVLAFLLLPRPFLAAYGVPHFTILTGLVSVPIVRRIGAAYLFLVLLAAIQYVRTSRRAAPGIRTRRPKDLGVGTAPALMRQSFQIGLLLLSAAWLLLTQGFWRPFSLLQWPPGLESLTSPVGLAALAFALALPALMFVALAGHLEAWRRSGELDRDDRGAVRLRLVVHIALCLLVVVLHGRNLLWLAAFEAAGAL